MRPFVLTAGVAALVGATSCGALDASDHRDHNHTEASIGGDALRSTFVREAGFLVSEPIVGVGNRVSMMLQVNEDWAYAPMTFEARGVSDSGAESEWRALDELWSEEDLRVLGVDLPEGFDRAEIRVSEDAAEGIAHLTWATDDLEDFTEGELAGDSDGEIEVQALAGTLPGYLQTIGVRSRASWGARATKCNSVDKYKSKMAIHHTVTAPSTSGSYAAAVRGIQYFHQVGRGWCDVGYHFLITRDGTIWEARPLHFQGAHVLNHNLDNIGISYVGCFQPGACGASVYGPNKPSTASITAGGKLVRALAKKHGISIDKGRVKGHRQHSGQTTSCPGDNLLGRLDDIRKIARNTGKPPVADFSISKHGGVRSLEVSLSNESSGKPERYRWDFDGDGTWDSSTKNPSYAYLRPGTKRIVLKVSNDFGSSTKTRKVTIHDPPFSEDVQRLWPGSSRAQYAARVSKRYFDAVVPNVYVAHPDRMTDSMVAAWAAAHDQVPFLYVWGETVGASTRTELERLRPERVTVIGRRSHVSDDVVEELRGYASSGEVDRLDEWAVDAALILSADRFDAGVEDVFIAVNTESHEMALAATVAAQRGVPFFLTGSDQITQDLRDELTRLQPQRITVIGRWGTFGKALAQDLEPYAPNVRRWGGGAEDSIDLATRVSAKANQPEVRHTYLCSVDTEAFLPSLVAVAGQESASILYVHQNGVPSAVHDELARLTPIWIALAGSRAHLTARVQSAVRDYPIGPQAGDPTFGMGPGMYMDPYAAD